MTDEEILKSMFDREAYRKSPVQAFRNDIDSIRPRFMDTYILPSFVLWYAWRSKTMGKWPRRVLFTGGMYMLYRNAKKYREAAARVRAMIANRNEAGRGASLEDRTAERSGITERRTTDDLTPEEMELRMPMVKIPGMIEIPRSDSRENPNYQEAEDDSQSSEE